MLTINPLNKIDLFLIFIKFEIGFVVDLEGRKGIYSSNLEWNIGKTGV